MQKILSLAAGVFLYSFFFAGSSFAHEQFRCKGAEAATSKYEMMFTVEADTMKVYWARRGVGEMFYKKFVTFKESTFFKQESSNPAQQVFVAPKNKLRASIAKTSEDHYFVDIQDHKTWNCTAVTYSAQMPITMQDEVLTLGDRTTGFTMPQDINGYEQIGWYLKIQNQKVFDSGAGQIDGFDADQAWCMMWFHGNDLYKKGEEISVRYETWNGTHQALFAHSESHPEKSFKLFCPQLNNGAVNASWTFGDLEKIAGFRVRL